MFDDIQLPKLRFLNPVHNKGINMTVRKGNKWLGVTKADVEGLGERKIITFAIPFNEIRDYMLQFEHDPSCRKVSGLYNVMLEAYPGFEYTDHVTLVFYNG